MYPFGVVPPDFFLMIFDHCLVEMSSDVVDALIDGLITAGSSWSVD